MGLSKEIADLIQKDTDTNIRIDDLELAVEDIESEVVKVTDEDYKKGPNYFTNTPLMEPADNGEEITTIRSDFINADSKLRLGMKNTILESDKNIKDIYISEYSNGGKITIIHSFPVYVGRETAYYGPIRGDSRLEILQFIEDNDVTLNGEGDPASENCPIPWGSPHYGMLDNDNLRATKIYIHVPMYISFKLKTKTDNVTSLPIFYSYETLTNEGEIKYVGETRYSPGWYSTEHLPESYFKNNISQLSEKPVKTLKGLYVSPLSWFNELTKDKYEIDENSIEITADLDNAYYEDYVYNNFYTHIWDGTDDPESAPLWFLTVHTNPDRELVNPCNYISYDSENNKFVINGPVIRGDNNAYDRLYMVFNPGSNSYSVSSYENGSLEYPGPNITNINAFGDILTNDKLIIGNDWSYSDPRWIDWEPYNKELAEWNQGDWSSPFIEGMNLSNNSLKAIITYEDDTTKEIIIPIFYADRSAYSPYSLIEKGYISRASVSSYDKYYTTYTRAKFLQYQRYVTDITEDYAGEEASPYDLLLGSNNISLNNSYDILNGKNHAFIGDNNYLLGNAFNSKVIGDYNFVKVDDKIILIGNDNIDYNGIIQGNDIAIINELNGFLVRGNKSYLLVNGEAIEIIPSYKLVRDETDDSYINLTDYFDNVLFRIYAPYELKCDENGISLGNNVIRFPTDTEIGDMFNTESTMSLYYPISYNSLKTFYNYLKENGLGYYVFGSDDLGLFLEDYKKIKRYVTWESFSEDDYIDIFNNTDSYEYGGKKLW